MLRRCRMLALADGASRAEKAELSDCPYWNMKLGDAGPALCSVASTKFCRALLWASTLLSLRRFCRLSLTKLSMSALFLSGSAYALSDGRTGAWTAGTTTGVVAAGAAEFDADDGRLPSDPGAPGAPAGGLAA